MSPNGKVGLATEPVSKRKVHSISSERYAESTYTGYLASIIPDLHCGVEEGGRIYTEYGLHKSWLPMDDQEMERNDYQHCKFTLLMQDCLYLAPIRPDPHRILDLGTGSGIWALEMAEKFTYTTIIGVDIAAVQPSLVPPNLRFEIDDVESDWVWPKNSFDFIHGREFLFAIHDWPRLIKQSFEHLKPGGYLQLCGTVPLAQTDDDSFPPNCAYRELLDLFFEMGDKVGVSGKAAYLWKEQMTSAGFIDVVETVFKIPTNSWPKDARMKKIGAFELMNFREGLNKVFDRAYMEILGRDPVIFERLVERAREEVLDRKMHSYVDFWVVYGKRPEGSAKT